MSPTEFTDEDDMLAAEFALGLLDGDAAMDAERRAREDGDFAAKVAGWEIQFADMADELDPVAPNPRSKEALMARMFPPETPEPVWRKLWVWQVASLILLAVIVFGSTTAPPLLGPSVSGPSVSGPSVSGPLYSAEIISDDGVFRVIALVDKRSDEIVLTRTAGSAPDGRILQVWAHGPGEPAESVGLWPTGDTVRLRLPPRIAAVDGVLTIGVSEEPPGGSPTGSPSGRVFGTVDIPGVTDTF